MNPALKKILLVEDDADIRVIVQLALEQVGGFTVCLCNSGQEALTVAQTFKPDLILLDVMMPGMSGQDTLRALRSNAPTASIPIIFMTAKIHADEVEAYWRQGIADIIGKPFDPMALSDRLRSIWQRLHP